MDTFTVPNPMPRPNYAFTEMPTTDQLRQRAVQGMRDHLSIQWSTHKKIVHSKTGPVSGKRFIYDANVIFCGLPYTNGDKGLFQFLEYYDHETGRLKFDGTGEEFNKILGCTCAGGVMWGWSTVCHTLTGRFVNFYMVPKHGCYPVGDYTFDFSIDSYKEYSTKNICLDNGMDCILDAYSKILPADAVTSSPKDHTMMAIEPAHTVYTEDGKIDPDASYVVIQDQCGGCGAGFYDIRQDDDLLHYSGRISQKFSFRQLYDWWYIPVTVAEFMGTEPYARAHITFDGNPENLESVLAGTLHSNYPMAVLKVIATAEDGTETMLARAFFDKTDVQVGLARNYPLENLKEQLTTVPAGAELRLEATATNGEVIVPVQFSV